MIFGKKESTVKSSAQESVVTEGFAIPKKNILYIIAGFLVMVLGYVIMMGGGSEDPNVFNYEMFSASRTVVAPILILAGMVIEIWAIMYRGKNK